MRIQNFRAGKDASNGDPPPAVAPVVAPVVGAAAVPGPAVPRATAAAASFAAAGAMEDLGAGEPRASGMPADAKALIERQGIEIALLKARIDHLEIVVETARGLLGGNHERLLRRLYDLPRDVVKLSQRFQRSGLAAPW